MIRDLINWSLQALLADALGKETLVEASNVVSNAVHRIFSFSFGHFWICELDIQ